jgi:hypothetical protein
MQTCKRSENMQPYIRNPRVELSDYATIGAVSVVESRSPLLSHRFQNEVANGTQGCIANRFPYARSGKLSAVHLAEYAVNSLLLLFWPYVHSFHRPSCYVGETLPCVSAMSRSAIRHEWREPPWLRLFPVLLDNRRRGALSF